MSTVERIWDRFLAERDKAVFAASRFVHGDPAYEPWVNASTSRMPSPTHTWHAVYAGYVILTLRLTVVTDKPRHAGPITSAACCDGLAASPSG